MGSLVTTVGLLAVPLVIFPFVYLFQVKGDLFRTSTVSVAAIGASAFVITIFTVPGEILLYAITGTVFAVATIWYFRFHAFGRRKSNNSPRKTMPSSYEMLIIYASLTLLLSTLLADPWFPYPKFLREGTR